MLPFKNISLNIYSVFMRSLLLRILATKMQIYGNTSRLFFFKSVKWLRGKFLSNTSSLLIVENRCYMTVINIWMHKLISLPWPGTLWKTIQLKNYCKVFWLLVIIVRIFGSQKSCCLLTVLYGKSMLGQYCAPAQCKHTAVPVSMKTVKH